MHNSEHETGSVSCDSKNEDPKQSEEDGDIF